MKRHRRPQSPVVSTRQTFRPRVILALVAIAATLSLAVYGWQLQSLTHSQPMQPPVARERPVAIAPVEPKPILIAERPQGVPLPPELLSRPNSDGTFWYVGKTTTESLVEIPFPPGRLPGKPSSAEPPSKNPGFLGAHACQACHEEKHATFVETSHHLTSQHASSESIAGSFESGSNVMRTKDPQVSFTMVARDGRFYQRVLFYGWEFEIPIDLVIGSSKLGQAFLYWDFNALYQTHVTYLTETDSWTNSPGYLDGDAAYARPIRGRCMECHSTYAEVGNASNRYIPNSIVLGISCERCHGPGQTHVSFHEKNPMEKIARYITVPSKLSRSQQIDTCGQCHSGGSQPKGSPFAFRPGDRLEDHYHPLNVAEQSNSVHASNQATRLAISKCFQQSQMACIDCHNPHRNERNQMALFSSRCMKCHEPEQCGETERLGDRIKENCIDCHMPKEATENMKLEGEAGTVFPPLRDHFIHVDPEATAKFLRGTRN